MNERANERVNERVGECVSGWLTDGGEGKNCTGAVSTRVVFGSGDKRGGLDKTGKEGHPSPHPTPPWSR